MPKKPKAEPESIRGGAINLYLHEVDKELINELRKSMQDEDEFPSRSQVIRTALRLAKPGPAFAKACHEVMKVDGRRKP